MTSYHVNDHHHSSDSPSEVLALSWRSMYLSRAKLKATSRTSALLSGFAMVALVELELGSSPKPTHPALIMAYAISTALMVSVHLLALMMSTCILPHLDAVSAVHSFNSSPSESPHFRLKWYIDTAWFFSTVLGLLLFLVEIGIVFLIKLRPLLAEAGYVTSAILIPVGVIFIIFTVTFYRKLAMHRYEMSKEKLAEIDRIHAQLDQLERGAGCGGYNNQYYGAGGANGLVPPSAVPYGYSSRTSRGEAAAFGGPLGYTDSVSDEKDGGGGSYDAHNLKLLPPPGSTKFDAGIVSLIPKLGAGSESHNFTLPNPTDATSLPASDAAIIQNRVELGRLKQSLLPPYHHQHQQQQQKLLLMSNGGLLPGAGESPSHYVTPPNSGTPNFDISPSFRRLTSGPEGRNAAVPILAEPPPGSASRISSTNCSPSHTSHSQSREFFPGA